MIYMNHVMKLQHLIFAFVLAIGNAPLLVAQTDEEGLDATQAKITTVSAMRARKSPQVAAEEVVRLKLGTVVNAVARSANQDTIGGKTDYWYRVDLPNGQSGWLFGGLLLDYSASKRQELVRQIIEARLKAENTDFSDRQEIYNLATNSLNEAKDVSTRAEAAGDGWILNGAKRFVLHLQPEVFRLLMDGIMVAAGISLLWTAFS